LQKLEGFIHEDFFGIVLVLVEPVWLIIFMVMFMPFGRSVRHFFWVVYEIGWWLTLGKLSKFPQRFTPFFTRFLNFEDV
jgi:hypothetical protein